MGPGVGLESFIPGLFRNSPMPPFSFHLGLHGDSIQDVLRTVLLSGARLRYDRQLHELSEREKSTLREYLLSLGWDLEYKVVTAHKEVLDYHPDGSPYVLQMPLNNIQIFFKPADPALNRYSSHTAPML